MSSSPRLFAARAVGRAGHHRYSGADRAAESDAVDLASQGHRSAAAAYLLHTLQRSNFYTYSRYSSSLDELGFEQSRLVTDGGQANYLVEIVEASEHGFRATATAVVDFDGDGVYNVWEIDQDKNLRETVKD